MMQFEREKRMKIVTKKFGTLDVDENSVIEFPNGLIGFEKSHRFALIKNEDFDPFCWLVSLEGEELTLPILNPQLVYPDFNTAFATDSMGNGHFFDSESGNVFCVVTINGNQGRFTINLKSPILIDFEAKVGKQLILDSEELVIDQPVW